MKDNKINAVQAIDWDAIADIFAKSRSKPPSR